MFKKIKAVIKTFVQKIKTTVKNFVQKITVSVDSHVKRNIIKYFIAGLVLVLVMVGTLMYGLGSSSNMSLIHEAFLNGQKDAFAYTWDTLYDADIDLFNKVLAVADAAALKA